MEKSKIRKITITAVLSAISAVLMFLETPLPGFPPFLQIDASDLPAIICAFGIGPIWGVAVGLIKNSVHMLATKTMVAGEIANFLIGASFVLPAGIIYKKNHTKKGALLGLVIGTVTMALAGVLTNLYITLPFYSKMMPMDTIIEISNKVNPYIKDVMTLTLYGITPFNILKGILLSAITMLIYKPLSPILHYSKRPC
ncbi:MAG: ECF transporter S component [Firmicutes bacterium]|nr:ECF transporter S component [Bacillota bacterium]